MPTKREREYYREGFADGMRYVEQSERIAGTQLAHAGEYTGRKVLGRGTQQYIGSSIQIPKRKLSAWNKYVKANSKKPRFRYRNGKLNLKKMAVAFRKTQKRGGKR
jgi:hypothetical protein